MDDRSESQGEPRGERDVIRLRNPTEDKRAFRRMLTSADLPTKIANFSRLRCLAIPKRDLSTYKTKPNIEMQPKSLGFMLEFFFIERGLLRSITRGLRAPVITNKIKKRKQTNQLISDLPQSYVFFNYFF